MSGIFQFFLNALKAIFLGPFYIVYFIFYFVGSLINHLLGELKVLFTGFKYGHKEENKYTKKLKIMIKKAGGR